MKSIIKNALILLAITLIAGLSLAFVHDITKEPIKRAQEEAALEAYRAVYNEADSFEELTSDISAYKAPENVTVDEVKIALSKDKETLGWVMKLTSKSGYVGDITLALGISEQGILQGMTVLSMSETPGLGAKCTSDDFQEQFVGIGVGSIVAVKDGKSAEGEIDAISGATFTTNAVLEAVNCGIDLAHTLLMPSEK